MRDLTHMTVTELRTRLGMKNAKLRRLMREWRPARDRELALRVRKEKLEREIHETKLALVEIGAAVMRVG